jgi:hypothetical protein
VGLKMGLWTFPGGNNAVTDFESFKTAWDAEVQHESIDLPNFIHGSNSAEDCFKGAKTVQFSRAQDGMRTFERFKNHANWKAETLWVDHDYDLTDALESAEAYLGELEAEKGPEHRTVKHWQKVCAVLSHVRYFFRENEIAGEFWPNRK